MHELYDQRQNACTSNGTFALLNSGSSYKEVYSQVGSDGWVRINEFDKAGNSRAAELGRLVIGDRFKLTNLQGGGSTIGDFGLYEVRDTVTYEASAYYKIPAKTINSQGRSGYSWNDHNVTIYGPEARIIQATPLHDDLIF